jgi:hypothetical protein
MAATNFTNIDTASSALVNAAIRQGITTSTSIAAHQLPISILANVLEGQAGGAALLTGAADGITSGTGTIAKTGIVSEGGIIRTTFLMDLTGLSSSTTDLDIIGKGLNPAFIGRITAAQNGTVIGGSMTCLEAPTGGVTDIDLYAATEGTGVFDGAIASLTETAVVTSAGAWTLGRTVFISPDAVAANAYLYLTSGAAGTAAAYTAGRYLITLYGV